MAGFQNKFCQNGSKIPTNLSKICDGTPFANEELQLHLKNLI